MKTDMLNELKRKAVIRGYANSVEEVPGNDVAEVQAFINDAEEAANAQSTPSETQKQN